MFGTTNKHDLMKVYKRKNFGYILDAIDLMPTSKPPKWVRILDAFTAFVIVTTWALILYQLYKWQRK